jgi:ABC-type branched-subunit amino acid transport system substrate-binding protein
VIAQCGIPEIRGLSTTDQMKAVKNAFPVNAAGQGGERSMAPFGWAKDQPGGAEAIKKAAYVYSDGDVTRQLEQQDVEGAEKMLGYDFIDEVPVGTAETNYGPAVNELKSKGAEYVTFVGAYQQAANLAKEFVKQGYKPKIYQPTVTAYTPDFLKQAGSAAEGTYVAVAPSLLEEANGNAELQLYAQWLQQVKPGASPTAIGQFAWAAAALFVQKMVDVGPRPTRKALLALLPGVHSYDGNGLFPAQDVGGRQLTDCTAVVQVQGGKFVRITPAGNRALRCVDGVWNSKTKQPQKGFPK